MFVKLSAHNWLRPRSDTMSDHFPNVIFFSAIILTKTTGGISMYVAIGPEG